MFSSDFFYRIYPHLPTFQNRPLLLVSESNDYEGDCDCACSDAPFTIATHTQTQTSFTSLADAYTLPLDEGFYLAFGTFAPAGPSVLNATAWERYQAFAKQPQPLTKAIDRDLARQNLLVPEGQTPQISPMPPEQLTAWLHVTNACNLECPYCYVRKSSDRMTLETGLNALETLFSVADRQNFSRVKLKYAGGESTLHFSLVRQLHDRALELARKYDLALKETVLSNGVAVTPAMMDWLEATGARLAISLDGLGAVHDRQRPMKGSGASSFERVVRTLESLRSRQIDLYLSVTVTGANAPHLAEVVRWIVARNWPFGLNFYRQTPLSADWEALQLEEAAIVSGMRSAYRAIEESFTQSATRASDRPFLNGLLDKIQTQPRDRTCGVGKTYVAIEHNGRVSQCQMHLNRPVQNAPNSETLLSDVQAGPIQNLPVREKEGCQTCTYRYRCTGGCPLETFRATGRWDIKSPNCNIYRALYPELLRLEGLRLLKIHREQNP